MTTMTRARAGVLCAAIASVLSAVAVAAQPLTAEKAVEIALKRNSQIVTSAADVLDAKSGVLSAASGVLPHVTASVSRGYSLVENSTGRRFVGGQVLTGGSSDITSYQTSPTLSGTWSVLDVSGLTALRSARQGVKAADLRRTSTRQDVALETLRRFYDVVRAVQLANVAEGTLRVARDDERRVRALFEVGSVSKSDVLKAQVRSEQSQLDSLTAKESITTTRFALAQQIGISESAMGEVDTVLAVEPRDYDEPALIAEAVKNRPDLRAAQAELQAANASLTSARFARLPYVTLSGSVTLSPKSSQSTTTNTVDSQGNPVTIVSDFSGTDDREWRGAVALNLDLFDGLATESRTALARARVIRARESRDALQRNLTSEVHAALLLYQEALERNRVAGRSVESAAENLNLIQQKYNVGSATILELVDAEVQLQRARSDAVSALAALRVAEAQIERVRGSGR